MKKNNLDTPSGVHIICGKTGDGLSATLKHASALNEISPKRSFVLEEPVEFALPKTVKCEQLADNVICFV